MKTLKKGLSIFLVVCMLFSTFAFICVAADEGRDTVNVRVDTPKDGRKADFSIRVDKKGYVPGLSSVVIDFWEYPENMFAYCGKILSLEEYLTLGFQSELEMIDEESVSAAEKHYSDILGRDMSGFLLDYEKLYASAMISLATSGIFWIEYDENDIAKIREKGLYNSDTECLFSTPISRFMQPGDTFKEGKSYACGVATVYDVNKQLNEYKTAIENLKPYYEKKAELSKKLENADENERTALSKEYDALQETYKDKLEICNEKKEAAYKAVYDGPNGGYYFPEVTVNGKKTEEFRSDVWFAFYDFGKLEKTSVMDMIMEFFENIVDFLRNLFKF